MKLGSGEKLGVRAGYHRFRYWVWAWRAFVLAIIALGLPIYDPDSRGAALLPAIFGVICVLQMLAHDSLENACDGSCEGNHNERKFWR